MNALALYNVIEEVLLRKGDQWDEDGDAWLVHPDPDSAYLDVGSLASALVDAIREAERAA